MTTTQDLPVGNKKKEMVRSMFDDIAPTYEKANSIISLGMDNYGRKVALKELRARPGSIVIDLASGTGDMYRLLEQQSMKPIACDLSFGMLAHAHPGENRIQCDGTLLPLETESCDAIVCGYALRNFVDLTKLFPELMRVLKPGGRFVAVDVSVPSNPLLRMGNKLWFAKIAPKIGWLISKNKSAYEYLPRSTAYLPSKAILTDMLSDSGATNISITDLIGGSLVLISATKNIAVKENNS